MAPVRKKAAKKIAKRSRANPSKAKSKTPRKKTNKKTAKKAPKKRNRTKTAAMRAKIKEAEDKTAGGNTYGGDRYHNCRPTQYTPELGQFVLDQMLAGVSLLKMMRNSADVPHRGTVLHWCNGELGAPSDYRLKYARARQLQADAYAERTVVVAEELDDTAELAVMMALEDTDELTPEQIARVKQNTKKRSIEASRLLSDNLKWTSARMHPRRWGDQLKIAGGEEEDSSPIKVSLKDMPTSALEKIAALEKQLRKET